MALTEKRTQKAIYFSDRLISKFDSFVDSPCTVIEAPMGYGKTTLIKSVIESYNYPSVWQRVYENGVQEFWKGFCKAISKIDENCAKGLLNIEMLEDSLMRREIMSLIEDIQIETPTFFVIDDYHYLNSPIANEFLKLLIKFMPKNLFLIVSTRSPFLNNSVEFKIKGYINHIDHTDLKFSAKDINGYFKLQGISLKFEDTEKLYQYSEGWISAIYLLALEYQKHGIFIFTNTIQELVYDTIYNPLADELKLFLLQMCHFEEFDLNRAQRMNAHDKTSEFLNILTQSNAFITFDPVTSNYSFHNIFSQCIKDQFSLLDFEAQKRIWTQMGQCYLQENEYIYALDCFYKGQDFDNLLLSLELDRAKSISNERKKDLIKYFRECPLEVKKRHLLSILVFSILMLTQFKEREVYAEAISEFFTCLQDNPPISEEEKNQLLGEYEVLQTFIAYNDLVKIGEHNAKASKLLSRPPRFINTKNSFTFGSPSILYLYYRESGKLKDLIYYLKGSTNYYEMNTGGHGNGYKEVLEGEWLYYIGQYSQAEIQMHKSIPLITQANQTDVTLCAHYFLAKLSLVKGDYASTLNQMDQMEALVKSEIKINKPYWLLYSLDLCKGYILALLGQDDSLPLWIYEYEYPKHMGFLSIAYANIVYGRALVNKGEYTKLIGLSDQFLELASLFPNLMAVVYTKIYLVISYFDLDQLDMSQRLLSEVLHLAAPDRLLMPFIENINKLEPILTTLQTPSEYETFVKEILKLGYAYSSSINQIINDHFSKDKPHLTKREKEISLLVILGLTNREIAEKLFISENTVKADLKIIFRKFNINSRSLLTDEMLS